MVCYNITRLKSMIRNSSSGLFLESQWVVQTDKISYELAYEMHR